MNKKGFTLVELILVVVILGIISVIVFPGIMKSLNQSKVNSAESIEKVLRENLELYNMDHKDDIWCNDDSTANSTTCLNVNDIKTVTIQKLYNTNPDIDMGKCLLQNNDSLQITKKENGTFSYTVKIVCGNNLEESSESSKVVKNFKNLSSEDYYYATK